ncbi:MAG TPA: class I SAM-dependent methyltransferase [Spirochaetia bacterium]|nr:class I SAM-dependent methyltransferase [Spirochaetia bacterium]
MNDNRTAYRAEEYDGKISATVPHYGCFHRETIDLVRTLRPAPAKWLDTGCGTGTLVAGALGVFPQASFVLADPSPPMLAMAAAKLAGAAGRVEVAQPAASQDLNFEDGSFDVVTAVLSHHYLDLPTRKRATANCLRMLKSGGVYVTFENIRPFSEQGIRTGLDRWKGFQLREGKSAVEVEKHLARFGQEYFPITIGDHLDMLRDAGFSVAELFWASYMQAGFWALKA